MPTLAADAVTFASRRRTRGARGFIEFKQRSRLLRRRSGSSPDEHARRRRTDGDAGHAGPQRRRVTLETDRLTDGHSSRTRRSRFAGGSSTTRTRPGSGRRSGHVCGRPCGVEHDEATSCGPLAGRRSGVRSAGVAIGDERSRDGEVLGVTSPSRSTLHLRRAGVVLRGARAGDPRKRRRPAHPHIRTLFALIAPSEIGPAGSKASSPTSSCTLFATASTNRTRPPHWLNEGLAVYLSDGYGDSDRQQVEQAAGTIDHPARRTAGAFPTTPSGSFSPPESVSAVARIVDVHGRDPWSSDPLVADGVSDDGRSRQPSGARSRVRGGVAGGPRRQPTDEARAVAPRPDRCRGLERPRPKPSFEVPGQRPPAPGSPSGPVPTSGDDPLAVLVSSSGLIGLALVVVIGALAIRRARREPIRLPGRSRATTAVRATPTPEDPDAERPPPRRPGAAANGSSNSGWSRRATPMRTRVGLDRTWGRCRLRRTTGRHGPTRSAHLAMSVSAGSRDPELAGHARGRAAGPRFSDRRTTRIGGASCSLHHPGAVSARRDGPRPPGPAGRPEGPDRGAPDADPGRRAAGRRGRRRRSQPERPARGVPDRRGPDPAQRDGDRPASRGFEPAGLAGLQ